MKKEADAINDEHDLQETNELPAANKENGQSNENANIDDDGPSDTSDNRKYYNNI